MLRMISLFIFCSFCNHLSADLAQTNGVWMPYAEGHRRFLELHFKNYEKEYVRLVAEGQSPKTLFIGCSDSRVIPEMITSTKPGDLFVIRNAGNFVPTFDDKIAWDGIAATIQFAVQVLGVKEIIVCGHSHCGAIRGLFEKPNPNFELLNRWLQWGQAARKLVEDQEIHTSKLSEEEKYELTGHLSVLYQLEHLLSYPFVLEQVKNNQIHLHGWYFSIDSGQLEYFDPEAHLFRNISEITKNKSP